MPTTTTARILRFEVPVDDRWHILTLPGPIVHIATRRPDVVEVWATTDGCYPQEHDLRVYGTGEPYPADCGNVCHVGTAIAPGGALVWHLMQRGPNRPADTKETL
ncbi:hypothetical protein JNW88_00355 [Micromonospora sp. ATA32]|nr:hypothetical protein [Micromonospora sp. ATA32]